MSEFTLEQIQNGLKALKENEISNDTDLLMRVTPSVLQGLLAIKGIHKTLKECSDVLHEKFPEVYFSDKATGAFFLREKECS